MLRKRSRSLQKDQYKDHLMPDSGSESCFQSYVLGQKQKSNSFFSIPGLFVGFSTKGLSDSDSVRSPTSPLDFWGFSNLGNPFRSPRSCHEGNPQRIWDCSKVGLGIVDALDDETKPSGTVLRSSESRNIPLGSQLKNIPNSPNYRYKSIDSFTTPNSLPKNYVISPDTQIQSPQLHLGSSDVVFETGETPLELGRSRSCLSDSGRFDPISSFENFWSEKRIPQMGSSLSIGRGRILDNSLGMKPSSLPMSTGSVHGFMGSLSATEIELSEDYTCVISHGPDRRTTHIFGDCILECHKNELDNCNIKEEQQTESPWVLNSSDISTQYPSDDFLSFCYSCKKKLEEGKDIYMYRGEKAFCSCSCRSQEILVEEEMEKTVNNSSENSPKSTHHEELFLTGMVVAT
ncbi:hypothetical protein HHK36_006150 [Tetracentron sinense]|uniref:FLZ-type domain-containing protein n=1 Tax=Tetracentron sinense TaxID=13715 RepID=A0A835DKL3_TETSI|nr:hypothetical protein HHK36_006150 [Tetracentron sinense]